MRTIVLFALMTGTLSGCTLTQPEPYQADREPEDRTEYNGIEGVTQQQKDQSYLMSKELADKCFDAKVDIAVAESQGDEKAVKMHKRTIKDTCKQG